MESKEKTMDLTTGHPLRQILIFSIPLVFGTIFQQLYSFADTVIVGRCLGTDALAAVGATSSLHFLILGFVQGACVGFGIPVAQSYGAKDRDEMCRYLWNGTWICLFISLFLSLGSVLLTDTLLAIMNTPEEIFFMARAYIVILFAGISASVLYNYSASVMRAMGDSRHPFYFLLFSSVLNVILDYVLIAFFHMGVSGAAAATVFSQFVSGALNVWWMFRRMDMIQGKKSQMKPSLPHIKRLCVVGLPMGFEYSVSAIGAVILQNSINTLGSGAVAAQTAGEKIRQMFTLPMESVGMAIATYAGQNFGAGKLKRIRLHNMVAVGQTHTLKHLYTFFPGVFSTDFFMGTDVLYKHTADFSDGIHHGAGILKDHGNIHAAQTSPLFVCIFKQRVSFK